MVKTEAALGLVVLSVFATTSCERAPCPSFASLRDEILRSPAALAILTRRDTNPVIQVRRFDGVLETIALQCCSNPVYLGWSSGRVIAVDVSIGSGTLKAVPAILAGGQVVVMDSGGQTAARSRLRIQAEAVAVTRDLSMFAFIGRPGNLEPRAEDYGLYIAGFDDQAPLRILGIAPDFRVDFNSPQPKLDWSADGKMIAFSSRASEIYIIDVHQKVSRLLAGGSGAAWSPTTPTLAYLSNNRRLIVQDVPGGSAGKILPTRELLTTRPPQWSPDGKYLLIAEHEVGVWPCWSYGHLSVLRLKDERTLDVPCYGMGGQSPVWIQYPANS